MRTARRNVCRASHAKRHAKDHVDRSQLSSCRWLTCTSFTCMHVATHEHVVYHLHACCRLRGMHHAYACMDGTCIACLHASIERRVVRRRLTRRTHIQKRKLQRRMHALARAEYACMQTSHVHACAMRNICIRAAHCVHARMQAAHDQPAFLQIVRCGQRTGWERQTEGISVAHTASMCTKDQWNGHPLSVSSQRSGDKPVPMQRLTSLVGTWYGSTFTDVAHFVEFRRCLPCINAGGGLSSS